MNIRVVGGIYGGRKLDAPAGRVTHPMGERIRNAIFNSLSDEIPEARVLDAFAGTGAVGIEALSRGAAYAVFVEKDKVAQQCITNNFATLQIGSAQLIKTSVNNWMETYTGALFDLIFADPPYDDTQLPTIARLTSLLAGEGMLVLSWPEQQEAPAFDGVKAVFDRVYAGARIVMYKNAK